MIMKRLLSIIITAAIIVSSLVCSTVQASAQSNKSDLLTEKEFYSSLNEEYEKEKNLPIEIVNDYKYVDNMYGNNYIHGYGYNKFYFYINDYLYQLYYHGDSYCRCLSCDIMSGNCYSVDCYENLNSKDYYWLPYKMYYYDNKFFAFYRHCDNLDMNNYAYTITNNKGEQLKKYEINEKLKIGEVYRFYPFMMMSNGIVVFRYQQYFDSKEQLWLIDTEKCKVMKKIEIPTVNNKQIDIKDTFEYDGNLITLVFERDFYNIYSFDMNNYKWKHSKIKTYIENCEDRIGKYIIDDASCFDFKTGKIVAYKYGVIMRGYLSDYVGGLYSHTLVDGSKCGGEHKDAYSYNKYWCTVRYDTNDKGESRKLYKRLAIENDSYIAQLDYKYYIVEHDDYIYLRKFTKGEKWEKKLMLARI